MANLARIWLPVYGDLRNPDWVPEYYLPSDVCPVCGAAYVELDEVHVSTPRIVSIDLVADLSNHVDFSEAHLAGVSLLCFEGHKNEHVPVSIATIIGAVGIGLFAVMASYLVAPESVAG